jgi:hypothetical protein
MSRPFRRENKIQRIAFLSHPDQACRLNHAPQFKNAEQYIQAKLTMLTKDFCIEPTKTEIKHLHELKTEKEIDCAVRQIINNHWG